MPHELFFVVLLREEKKSTQRSSKIHARMGKMSGGASVNRSFSPCQAWMKTGCRREGGMIPPLCVLCASVSPTTARAFVVAEGTRPAPRAAGSASCLPHHSLTHSRRRRSEQIFLFVFLLSRKKNSQTVPHLQKRMKKNKNKKNLRRGCLSYFFIIWGCTEEEQKDFMTSTITT